MKISKLLLFYFILFIVVTAIFFIFTVPVIKGKAILPKELETIKIEEKELDSEKLAYDIVVIGAEPEGIAAAISASRNGQKTLLIDKRDRIGGLMTLGWLNSIDMNYDPNHEILNKGIFYEFYQMIEGDSFSINTAQNAFNQLVEHEENLDVMLNIESFSPVLNDETVQAVEIIKEGKHSTVTAKYFIDATQDADFTYASGVPFTVGQEDYLGRYRSMASTLVFQLKNIDWEKIGHALKNDDYNYTGSNKVSAWGFYDEMMKYIPRDPDIGVRGLNIGRIEDNNILINALYIYGVDGLDEQSKAEGIEKAKKELEYIVPFMRENIPGFENAELVSVAPELYIRETRHMEGLYRLTIDDVLENRDFEDRIAFGSYPVDIQAISPLEKGYIVGNPKQYAIPFRSLVPVNRKNLLVVGRSASYDSLAHGSARVIPVGMAVGESAGAAAAYANEKDLNFHEIAGNINDIKIIQDRLNSQGMVLEPFSYPTTIENHWAYEGIKFVRSLGLISARYNNDYRLDESLTNGQLNSTIYGVNKRTNSQYKYEYGINQPEELATKNVFAEEILGLLGINEYEDPYSYLLDLDILSSYLEEKLNESNTITYDIIYMTLYEIYN